VAQAMMRPVDRETIDRMDNSARSVSLCRISSIPNVARPDDDVGD